MRNLMIGRHMFMDPTRMTIEVLYLLTVLVLCFLIYHKTKNAYELTKHKGINHFRNAFFFFGFAYVFRFVFLLIMLSGLAFDFQLPRYLLPEISLALMGYLSTMAIFSLVLSVIWKKVNYIYALFTAQAIAIVLSIIAMLTRSQHILSLIQLMLLIVVIVLSYFYHKRSKKFTRLFTIYILTFVVWIISMASIRPPRAIFGEFRIILYLISVTVFFVILHKVKRMIK